MLQAPAELLFYSLNWALFSKRNKKCTKIGRSYALISFHIVLNDGYFEHQIIYMTVDQTSYK